MDWLEVSVQVNGEAAEAVSEVFNRYGHGGAVIEETISETDEAVRETLTVIVYLPFENGQAVGQQEIEEALSHLSQLYPIPAPQFRHLSKEDWAHAWKKHYQVLRVGQRIIVKPSWQTYTPRPNDIVVELDPGMAFGTGLHPSTRLCLVALEEHLTPGMGVLDVGTGSGILAIAAAKLGAGPVLALDIDPVAVEATGANVAANKVGHIVSVEPGSWPALEPHDQTFDIVLVNILAETIVELLGEGLIRCLKESGLIVVSGIIESQEAMVVKALGVQGVDVVERLQEKDWVALVGSKRTLLAADL
ncbi:MAG: 50S ribosomal protein L11 methyltransferase [Anaerolineales bacterium]|nr:MAG: 50S ribosomal protein L11 methyltransferase [Anaerolineales bacterium]